MIIINKINKRVINLKVINSNYVGAFASSICLLHCLVTPLLFIIQSCSLICCESTPMWWRCIDYLFLAVSFGAVYRSNKTTSKAWVGRALWFSWFGLFLHLANDIFEWIILVPLIAYLPALLLISLHLYNQKYCQCSENCCSQ